MSVGKKRPPRFRVGDVVAFLYGPQTVPGEIVEDRGPLGVYGRRLYRVRIDRGQGDTTTFEISEEDIEGPWHSENHEETPGTRQEFDVTYIRTRKTNSWTASTKRGKLYKGVKAKGAVGYATGRWEGEREGDENHAVVTVFVECDETMCDAHSRALPTAWPVMVTTARKLADRMFMTRHPDAVIKHVDDDEDERDRCTT
jgi:hypothetical protein